MMGSRPKHPGIDFFIRELEARGYAEGKNLLLERRSAEGKFERFDEIISGLVRDKMDVIVTVGNEMAIRAKEITKKVPIVMAMSNDPVAAGIVPSLARPGGNVTGYSVDVGPEIEAKRFALFKEAVPGLASVAFLGLKADWDSALGQAVRSAAEQLKVKVFLAEASPNDFAKAFSAIEHAHVDGVFVASSPPHYVHAESIVQFAARNRLPDCHFYVQATEAGAFMRYGSNTGRFGAFHKAAAYVDKILRGARPADLPIEQPTVFELMINRKTAKALGLALPESILIQVNRIVE